MALAPVAEVIVVFGNTAVLVPVKFVASYFGVLEGTAA